MQRVIAPQNIISSKNRGLDGIIWVNLNTCHPRQAQLQKQCKSRTSNYWNHLSKIDDHAAPIRSPVRGRTGFSKSRGWQASVTFFPLPHPLPSTFLLLPHFSRSPSLKTPSRGPNFVCFVRESLLRRLDINVLNLINQVSNNTPKFWIIL